MVRLLSLLILLGVVGCNRSPAFPGGEVIDLTHPFDETTIYWPTESGFVRETRAEGQTDKGYYYSAYSFSACGIVS